MLPQAFALFALLTDSLRIVAAPAETLRVTIVGEGPAVVLLPGVFGSDFAFHQLIQRLERAGLRSIVVEPLGFGGGSRPRAADYSLTSQADRVAAVLDSLDVDRAIVVGHSLAGSIALRLAYRRPDLVRAVISLEGGPVDSIRATGLRSVTKHAALIKLFGTGAARGKFRGGLIKSSGDPSWVTDSVVNRYTAGPMRDLGLMLATFSRMVAATEPELLTARLGEITCPVHLVIGTAPHPEALKAADIDLFQTHLASFAIDTIPGAGHHLHEEQPDPVAAVIIRMNDSASPAIVAASPDRPPPP